MATVRSNLRLHSTGLGEVAVREWGEGDPAMLAWHSLGPAASGATMGELAALGDGGHRLIAVDAPGFGASPALPTERYALSSLVELLWKVADVLALRKPVLAGHSWGGVVASAAVGARPDGAVGLVLLDSGHLDYQDAPGYPADTSFQALLREHQAPERQVRAADVEELRRELEPLVRRPLTRSCSTRCSPACGRKTACSSASRRPRRAPLRSRASATCGLARRGRALRPRARRSSSCSRPSRSRLASRTSGL
jgi:pimeloyl-ACP methyl ester carboxylesterase